jgi:hypothetical protein
MNATARNTRTWSHDELRAAVASQTSWRGVAQALGLAQGSTSGIRRHAVRLNLDTSHFSGKRRWSEGDLRRAISEAFSWADVTRLLGISDTSEARLRIKGCALRLGLDMSTLEPAQSVADPSPHVTLIQPDPALLRVAAESIAIAWFTIRGISVAIPAEPREYDLP